MVMMRGIVGALEKHHNVRILDEAVNAAVRLSHRYLAGRQLPDKAVSVLDTACARLSLGQNSTPGAIEDLVRQIDDLEVQQRVLRRELAVGHDHSERLDEIGSLKTSLEDQLSKTREKWEEVKGLVGRIREIRTALEGSSSTGTATEPAANGASSGATTTAVAEPVTEPLTKPATELSRLRSELAEMNRELDRLQGETPLMRVTVDQFIVGEVISAWTGIPVGKMVKDEVQTILELERHLQKRVIGQDHAMELISQRIRTGRASLDDPGKPVGVFMLVGPSGVGKTETALALSDLMYGGEHNLVTINMSEFQEAHTVSTLKGSPPGYIGYGEGGVLTEAVRRRPYCVVLLDEVEKAHSDVLELFTRSSTKGRWRMARAGKSISRIRSSC